VAATLARWDVASTLAEVAVDEDWVRPEVDESLVISMDSARHPVVEALAARGRFVPNDVALDAAPRDAESARLWLVTGPNMAGKSTFLRQVALCTLLAQMGSYVPASKARIGLVDRILTRVGASDNLARGESTFMVEMKETAQVLKRATRRSLVVLDEIGRGTSTYDGLSIAWAVAEHLEGAIGCRALFATHYHELTELGKGGTGVANYSVQAREQEGSIVFLHRLQEGAASRSYGVACARLAGLPEPVLARAQAVLAELEAGPSGNAPTPAASKKSAKAPTPQLDLFAAPPVSGGQRSAIDTLVAVDVDRLTPLDALQLVARLRELVRS
jgi:DNA mismatch repair protein MutS